MTWINRLLIVASVALVIMAIGRFVLKSWIFAAIGALVVALVLVVYLGWVQRPRATK